ncbi:MAG TPA: MFS transporter, partial [Aquella sp.]|nr:MFS transporter [Aquella sp.]
RMLEAFGSSAGLVLSFTIINDYYFPDQARRIISYVVLAFAIIPGVATFIGGILVTHFHWISCFYFLLFYGLLIAIPIYYLEETATILDKHTLNISSIKSAYVKVFKNSIIRNTSLFFAMHGMCVYAYAATAPFIAIHTLNISPEKFGTIGLIPYVGTALGAIAAPYLSKKLSMKLLIKSSVICEIIFCGMLITLLYLNYVTLPVLVICGFLFMFSGCIIAINGSAMASSASEDKAIASSVMNFINIGMGMMGTFMLAFLPGGAELRLSIVFVIALTLMVLFWSKLKMPEEKP